MCRYLYIVVPSWYAKAGPTSDAAAKDHKDGVAQWLFNPKEWSERNGDVAAIAAKAAKRARRTERRMKVAA